MAKCIIHRENLGPVMDWSKGQPRIFDTKEDADSWAKLSQYGRYTLKPLKEEKRAGGPTN